VSNRAHKVVVTILIVAGILALAWIVRDVARRLHEGKPIYIPTEPPPAPLNLTENETARALAHPIKAGGVHSVAELLRLINSDPGVAAHYRALGFRPECANTMILATNTFARVSYRTDTGFAWTKTPVLLLAGENLLVDCEGHIIRMACANAVLLAEKTAQTDTGELFSDLIPPVDLSPTSDSPQPVPSVPSGPVPPLPPVLPLIDWYPAPCCLVPSALPVGSLPITTPEPPMWAMLVVGWGSVLVAFRIFRGPR
jgi:hypothetical protein